MDCSGVREALSARLDGEEPGLPPDELDAHLRACGPCASWASDADELTRRFRVRDAEAVPDLLASVTAAAQPQLRERAWRPLWPCRVTLAVVGLIQIVVSLPVVLVRQAGDGHVGHELGAWGLALGAGFLVAAWRPARAAGLVPFVAALVGFLLFVTTRDVLAGEVGIVAEASHSLELFGLVLLWVVARGGRVPGLAGLTRRLRPA